MLRTRPFVLAAVAVWVISHSSPASAAIVFDNYFGPNNGVATGGPFCGYAPGYFGGPPHLAPVTQMAHSFTVGAGNYQLESVHATMMTTPEWDSGNPVNAGVTMRIHSNAIDRPGAVLAAFNAPAALPLIPAGQGPVVTLPPTLFDFSAQNVLLEQGLTYWLSIEANNNGFVVWGAALLPGPIVYDEPGTFASNRNGAGWLPNTNDRSAFRVTGSPVPAPGSAALAAILGVNAFRRRRRLS